jgi:outer membrane immunogenic protein
LLGLEADIQGADIKDSVSAPVNMANFHPLFGNFSATQKIDWFGTVRGRLGYFLHPDWMVYATGGLAYGQVKESANLALTFANTAIAFGVGGFSFACVNAPVGPPPFAGGPVCFDGSHSRTSVGWTAGAGTEFKLTQNMTAKVEYLYVNLGNENFNIPAVTLLGPGNASILRVSFDDAAFHLFRGGLNWRF